MPLTLQQLGARARVPGLGVRGISRPPIRYLLGRFFKASTPNQSAPLPASYTEAGAVGALTVTDTGNKASVSGGRFLLTPQAAPANGDPRVQSGTGLARIAGRAMLWARSDLAASLTGYAGWGDSGGNILEAIYWSGTNNNRAIVNGGSTGDLLAAARSQNTSIDYAVILRGTGLWLLYRLTTSGPYTLLWVGNAGTTATLYPILQTFAGSFSDANLRVADLGGAWASDYGIALAQSTFTAADNTALTAITPEVGPAWTALVGTQKISSNKVIVNAIGGGLSSAAVVDAGQADVLVEATIVWKTGSQPCVVLRASDASNCWLVDLTATNVIIYEYNAASYIARATTAFTPADGTTYRVVVVASGTTISAYVNNVAYGSYASATFNQTATKHGIRFESTVGVTVDDFIVWPRTISLPSGV